MTRVVRRTSTKVVNGRVTRKSRSDLSSVDGYVIEKEPAGRGFTHVVSPRQLELFIELIPGWRVLSHRLQKIILAGAHLDYYGLHQEHVLERTASIKLHAWTKSLWTPLGLWFFYQHRHIFDALGVDYEIGLSKATCRFTVGQARAFSLLHVFLHEVGHHRDWQRRRGVGLPGVEDYAEDFADSYFEALLPLYIERFGDPASKGEEPSALLTP